MSTRSILTLALGCALGASASGQSLTLMPGFELNSLSAGTSSTVAVGRSGFTAARWQDGTVTTYPGINNALGVNAAGLSYAGHRVDSGALKAARFNLLSGWTDIPAVPAGSPPVQVSSATAIADSGLDLTGWIRFVGQSGFEAIAYRWSGSTLELLTDPTTGEYSFGFAISTDGSVIGGEYRVDTSTGVRRPVVWDANNVMQELFPADFPGASGSPGAVRALNADGTLAVGEFGLRAFLGKPNGVPVLLPEHPEVGAMYANGLSDDGKTVVGRNGNGGIGPSWIWTQGQGTRLIRDVAAQIGLAPSGSPDPFAVVRDISPDGRRLAGVEPDGQGGIQGWVLELPEDGVGQWIDLGESLAGFYAPELTGSGSLSSGASTQLVGAPFKPNGTAGLFIGLSRFDAPFKGGVLVPADDLLVVVPTILGTVALTFDWPVGLPSGVSLYFQMWSQDFAGPVGFNATNALEAVTP